MNKQIKQKCVTVYIPEDEHRQLRAILALQGKTVSGWFRSLARSVIKSSNRI